MITKRYTIVRTSLGDLFITADRDRITRIGTQRPHVSIALRKDTHPLLRDSATALIRYLSGECKDLFSELPLYSLPFQREVFEAVRAVPYGQSITAAELAAEIGKPHAVRAVETICRNNPLYIAVPCHRVIGTSTHTTKAPQSLLTDEALRQLEKRYLDKGGKRG